MKKLLLSVLVTMTAHFLAPVAQSQALCDANFQYVIGNVTPNGAQVSFYDSSFAAGNITNWSWSFGNGTGSTQQNPVGFLNPGTNIVCLTIVSVFQNQTCTDTYCDTIVIGSSPCNANFVYTSGPQGVQFDAFNTNNVSYTWSFGDGTSGTGVTPFHTYTSPGTYTVCLTVLDPNGTVCTSCQTITIGSSSGCQAYYTSNPVLGTTIYDFTNQSQGNATYFYWTFGDGGTSTLQNPSHAYNATGWYNVCLTITDSIAQCSDTYCDSILVGGGMLCDPNFVYQTSPAATVFIGTGQNNVSWSWDFGDGTTGTGGPTATHSYGVAGTYVVCLTVTQANGQTCTSCQSVVIQNAANCSSNFAIYPDSVTQHTYYAYNLATGVAPLTYTWSWGDGTSSNTAYPSHTYSGPGLYTICLTITDATGCTSNTCYQWQLLRLSGSGVPVTINVIPGTTGLQEAGAINALTVYPNPASDVINSSFTLAKETGVSLKIINVTGQVVYSLPSAVYGSGTHEIKLNASGLPKGMYLVEIQGDALRSHTKVVVR